MKPRFSFNDAVGAPFVLLRRRPLYLFAWGLMMMALVAVMYATLLPTMTSMVASADAESAFETYLAETIRLQMALNGLNVLVYLVMLVTWAAAGRAIMTPNRGDRFLYLRLGMDEVRVAVTVIAIFVALYAAMAVLILVGVGIGAALWNQGEGTAIIVLIVYGLLVAALSIWGWLRASLIAPATLILKRFAFAEGWRIARGQLWKLFGLNVVIWIIYMISAILMYAVAGAILLGAFFAQGLVWPQTIESVADLEPLIQPMILPALAAVLPLSFVFGWVMSLYVAPSVVAARQLLDGAPLPAAIAEDAPPADTLQPL